MSMQTAARAVSAEPTARDFLALLKPRVMSLVVFTGFVGMMLAPGEIHPAIALMALICIAVGAGASGAINMWYDADIDGRMERTASRPIPLGRVTPGEALGFGLTLSVISVLVMGLCINLVAAGLLAFTIAFYVLIYTMWLKRRTSQNIVIGGAAGAIPPMIGWAAVTGTVSFESAILFAIIFMWTPPHFWALALFRAGDYARVGVPMLPVVHGKAETRRQIFFYTVALVPLSVTPYLVGMASVYYAGVSAALSVGFLACAVRVIRAGDASDKPAKQMFGYSILYLFLLFALLLADRLGGLS